MNLDDLPSLKHLDPNNMLGEIDGLPDQIQSAWEFGLASEAWEPANISRVVIAGMGGSAIAADLLAAYAAPKCKVPIFVHRDYSLPAWARNKDTLVIASSHSGNTEEAMDAFEAALKNDCSILVVTTGGKLAKLGKRNRLPVWQFEHSGQPRAAVGFSFGLLLAAFARLALIGDPAVLGTEVIAATAAMKKQQENLGADIPVAQNPAKRMAGQLVGRWVNVFGSGCLAPVARRWKGQINELAKAGAGFEVLPEADHNALAGLLNPEDVMSHTMSIFLCAPSNHPRNRQRSDLTRQAFMVAGLNTDTFNAQGDSSLAHIWTAVHFGDYTAYYLAMAYGMDPTPIEVLENFKTDMKKAE